MMLENIERARTEVQQFLEAVDMTYEDYCRQIEAGPFSILSTAAKQQIKDWILDALERGFNNGYKQCEKDKKRKP